MQEQSNFRILLCLYRDEGVVIKPKNTSMTPFEIKSYLLIAIFWPFFFLVLGAKKPKEAVFRHPVYHGIREK